MKLIKKHHLKLVNDAKEDVCKKLSSIQRFSDEYISIGRGKIYDVNIHYPNGFDNLGQVRFKASCNAVNTFFKL